MSRVTCEKCGASWPLEKVAGRASFGCGRCHARVVVPAAASAQPLEVVQPLDVVEPLEVVEPLHVVEPLPAEEPAATASHAHAHGAHGHRPRHHGHGTHHHHHAPPAKKGVPAAVWIGAGVCVAGGVVAVALLNGGDAPRTGGSAASAARTPESLKADPMRDAAAWKALPDADRAAMATRVIETSDAND